MYSVIEKNRKTRYAIASTPYTTSVTCSEVVVAGGRVSIHREGREVAVHPESSGRRQRLIEQAHFAGLSPRRDAPPAETAPILVAEPELLRPLQEYERLVGGGW